MDVLYENVYEVDMTKELVAEAKKTIRLGNEVLHPRTGAWTMRQVQKIFAPIENMKVKSDKDKEKQNEAYTDAVFKAIDLIFKGKDAEILAEIDPSIDLLISIFEEVLDMAGVQTAPVEGNGEGSKN